MYKIDITEEKKEILKRYRDLLAAWQPHHLTEKKQKKVRRAFNLALEAHKDMRRKTGEPYIYHPLAVATICVKEMGLGETSIICALMHDVVEDTDYTLDDIRGIFGNKVAEIIDGLTKINVFLDKSEARSKQAENFKKIVLSMSKDVRVILIKLADRLHNMRTLESMEHEKQLKIASETLYFYAPFAHRLGLYAIKNDLEDLSLKYTEPDVYKALSAKIEETRADREAFIGSFIHPIKKSLSQHGLKYRITTRLKSINSIWNKMKTKGIRFEEVYDLFAVRIILDVPQEKEKIECWKVYSIVTQHYIPKHDRLRDWISTPKANGYESLHTTVMSSQGQWVEVQIRTERMHEIAERGYAAHWKYKDHENGESSLDKWINRINQLLKESENEDNALEFFDEFKLNLFSDEIFVFTPQGELRTLPKNATALDFAYSIHSEVGNRALGAKVNHKVVSLNQELSSGDQVEVITSKNVLPKEEWLNYVITPRAKNHIRKTIKQHRKQYYQQGESKLKKMFQEQNVDYNPENISKFRQSLDLRSNTDLYYFVAINKVTSRELKDCCNHDTEGQIKKNILRYLPRPFRKKHAEINVSLKTQINNKLKENPEELVLGDVDNVQWKTATCCNPIPGDDVIGYIKSDEVIEVHRINCPTAIQLMSKFGTRIVKAKWQEQGMVSVLAGIKLQGIDKKGLIEEISHVISQQHNINIRSINLQASDGIMSGEIMLYVNGNQDLLELIKHLKKIKNLHKIFRISRINE